jgi:hypothetical protein
MTCACLFRTTSEVHSIQINQPTRCDSYTSSLLDVCVWLNMFRAPLRPSTGAYNCTRSLWFYRWRVAVGALLVVVCRLMMGGETPETCWATHKRQVINFWKCCILLVDLFELYDGARTCKRQTSSRIYDFQQDLLIYLLKYTVTLKTAVLFTDVQVLD